MGKCYIDGNRIVSVSWYGKIDVFEIVPEFPCGYEVWNIGTQNFPLPGYLPLARFDKDCRMIKGCVLKAVKTDDVLAEDILNHKHGDVDYWKFKELEKEVRKDRSLYVNLADGEGIMVFTENEQMTEERIMAALLQVGMDVMEVYEVPEHEVSFYVYDPIFNDANFEKNVLRNAEKWYAANPGWTM